MKIRCANCRYYQVTWDAEKPYGCSKLGFKSRIEPSKYVVQVSGNMCRSFSSKTGRK
jgi:hypothetical protein